MKKLALFFVFMACLSNWACQQDAKDDFAALDQSFKHQQARWLDNLSAVVMSDIFSPPVCSRIYAYSNIAAYEALRPAYPDAASLGGKLKGLGQLPMPEAGKNHYFPLSSMVAFATVGSKLVFNGDTVAAMERAFLDEVAKMPLSRATRDQSIAYGRQIGQYILDWAAQDGYLQRNAQPAYSVTKNIARWQPTPPDYMDAVETNWCTLRPFAMDSAAQFRCPPPFRFDSLKGSPFHREALEVYTQSQQLTQEQKEIALFWDCNPNTSVTQGHVTYFQQKRSPPGHWLHLSAALAQQENFDALKMADMLAKVSIAMADGFIGCWESKYHYCLTRPETVINRYIDKDWVPMIQTPPFPEYPSGHSVCSGAASVVLQQFFGKNYAYTDHAEEQFGLPARSFKNLEVAAEEASISRFYGGIHFKNALVQGLEQGKIIGQNTLQRLIHPN